MKLNLTGSRSRSIDHAFDFQAGQDVGITTVPVTENAGGIERLKAGAEDDCPDIDFLNFIGLSEIDGVGLTGVSAGFFAFAGL